MVEKSNLGENFEWKFSFMHIHVRGDSRAGFRKFYQFGANFCTIGANRMHSWRINLTTMRSKKYIKIISSVFDLVAMSSYRRAAGLPVGTLQVQACCPK